MTQQEFKTITVHQDRIEKVQIIPTKNMVISASADGTLQLTDIENRIAVAPRVSAERHRGRDRPCRKSAGQPQKRTRSRLAGRQALPWTQHPIPE